MIFDRSVVMTSGDVFVTIFQKRQWKQKHSYHTQKKVTKKEFIDDELWREKRNKQLEKKSRITHHFCSWQFSFLFPWIVKKLSNPSSQKPKRALFLSPLPTLSFPFSKGKKRKTGKKAIHFSALYTNLEKKKKVKIFSSSLLLFHPLSIPFLPFPFSLNVIRFASKSFVTIFPRNESRFFLYKWSFF